MIRLLKYIFCEMNAAALPGVLFLFFFTLYIIMSVLGGLHAAGYLP